MPEPQDSPKVPEAAVQDAAREAFRSDNGGSNAPLTEAELDVMRASLQAAMPHMLSALLSDEVVGAGAKVLRDILLGATSRADDEAVREILQAAIEQVGGAERA